MYLLGWIAATIPVICWCSTDVEVTICYGGAPAPMLTSPQRNNRDDRDLPISAASRAKPARFRRPYRLVSHLNSSGDLPGGTIVTRAWWDEGCAIQCQRYGCFAFIFDLSSQGKPGKCVMYRKASSIGSYPKLIFYHIVDCDERSDGRLCVNQPMREPGYWIQYLLDYRGPREILAEVPGVVSMRNAVFVCLKHPLCNLFTAATDFHNRTFTIRLFSVALHTAQKYINKTLPVSIPLNATVRTIIYHECQPLRPLIMNHSILRPPQVNDSCHGRFVYRGQAPGKMRLPYFYQTYYQNQDCCLLACFVTPGCLSVIYELKPVFIRDFNSSRPIKCVVIFDYPNVPKSVGNTFHGFMWKWQCVTPQVPYRAQLQCGCTKRPGVVIFASKCSRKVRHDNITLPDFTGLICTGYSKKVNGKEWTQIQNPFFPIRRNMLGWVLSEELSPCDFGNCRYYSETKKHKVQKFSTLQWYPPPNKCLHQKKPYPRNTHPTLVVVEEVAAICYAHVCAAVLRQWLWLCYSRHWCCPPWNYFISNDGNIFEGRDPTFQPLPANPTITRHKILVAFLGNFTRYMPSPSALQALHVLVSHLKKTKKLDKAAQITTRDGIPAGRRPGLSMQQLIESASFNDPNSHDTSNDCPSPLPYTRIIEFYITCCLGLMSLILTTLLLIWKDDSLRGLMVCTFYRTESTTRSNNNHCHICSETIIESDMKLLTQNVNHINAVTLVAEDMDLVDAVRHKFISAAYQDLMVHVFLAQVADILLCGVSSCFCAVLLENVGGTELHLITACGVTETANIIVRATSQTEGWSQPANGSGLQRYFLKCMTKMVIPRGRFCSNLCFRQFVRCIPHVDILNAGGLHNLQVDQIFNMTRLTRSSDTVYTSPWDSSGLQY